MILGLGMSELRRKRAERRRDALIDRINDALESGDHSYDTRRVLEEILGDDKQIGEPDGEVHTDDERNA